MKTLAQMVLACAGVVGVVWLFGFMLEMDWQRGRVSSYLRIFWHGLIQTHGIVTCWHDGKWQYYKCRNCDLLEDWNEPDPKTDRAAR